MQGFYIWVDTLSFVWVLGPLGYEACGGSVRDVRGKPPRGKALAGVLGASPADCRTRYFRKVKVSTITASI